MSDLINDLREEANHFIPHEKVMKQWDMWRHQIAKGSTSSFPRDCFESLIDGVPEALTAAADALEARDKTIAELCEALEKSAQRNRYDGDLFHDQGIESRMEASWSAWEDASKLLHRISQAQSKDKAE